MIILQVMKEVISCCKQPRVLGLTAPLLKSTSDPGRLEGEIRRLEIALHSTAETASDIVSVLRYIYIYIYSHVYWVCVLAVV
jgi:hypothetical protein